MSTMNIFIPNEPMGVGQGIYPRPGGLDSITPMQPMKIVRNTPMMYRYDSPENTNQTVVDTMVSQASSENYRRSQYLADAWDAIFHELST